MPENIKYLDKVLAVWEDVSLPLELRTIYNKVVKNILLSRDSSFAFYQHRNMIDTEEDIVLLS